jgi:hypothetical protein
LDTPRGLDVAAADDTMTSEVIPLAHPDDSIRRRRFDAHAGGVWGIDLVATPAGTVARLVRRLRVSPIG